MFAFAGALILAAGALAGNGGLLPVTPHSPNAHKIQHAYIFVLVFAGIVLVGVEGVLLAFVIRYRRGRRLRSEDGPEIHGSTKLEVLWTVVPVLILAAIAGFVFAELPGISDAPAAAADEQTTITVEGHQFYWLFRYPNGAVTIGTMYAPAGQVVHENVVAPADDVVHSWWVPALGGKIDAIPGRVNHTWFQAPTGDYAARCSDLCGIQHTRMTALVRVVPREAYDALITERAQQPDGIALGKEEYQRVCATCHKLATAYIGPSLGSNPTLASAKDIHRILREGVGKMPAVGETWTDDQINALVAYTKTFLKVAQ